MFEKQIPSTVLIIVLVGVFLLTATLLVEQTRAGANVSQKAKEQGSKGVETQERAFLSTPVPQPDAAAPQHSGPAAPASDITYSYDDAGRLVGVDYGDGQSITYTYDAAGNLLSREIVAPGQCNALTDVGIQGKTSGYTDTLYTFTTVITPPTATEPITYTWTPEPDDGQDTGSAYYQWSVPGVYTITLTAENCGGPVSKTHAITIESPPPGCPHPLEEVSISGPTNGYTGTLYTFDAVIIPANATEPITYTWTPEPNNDQGMASAQYQWAAPDIYTITLVAENCYGTDSDVHAITIEVGEQYTIYLPLVMRDYAP